MNNTVKESSSKIFITSADTTTWRGSSTQLLIPVQPFILRSDDPSHFVLGVESLQLPLAIYVVNTTNNILNVNSVDYTIPAGNYTAATLLATLNLLAIPTLSTWTFSTTTYRLSVTLSGITTFAGTAQRVLGYTSGSKSAGLYTLETTINLAYTTGITVRLDNIQTENRCAGGGAGILARIPVTVAPFKVLQYFNPVPFYTTIANRSIQSIEISLLDDNYNPIILVGDPVWSITIRLDYVDKTSNENHKAILTNSVNSKLTNRAV